MEAAGKIGSGMIDRMLEPKRKGKRLASKAEETMYDHLISIHDGMEDYLKKMNPKDRFDMFRDLLNMVFICKGLLKSMHIAYNNTEIVAKWSSKDLEMVHDVMTQLTTAVLNADRILVELQKKEFMRLPSHQEFQGLPITMMMGSPPPQEED